MIRLVLTLELVATLATSAVVLDRVAVVVGSRIVKISGIDRDLRVTQFLNRQSLDLSVEAQRKSAERLIEQEFIRQEIRNGSYAVPTEQEVANFVQQIQKARFGGAEPRMRTELSKYGLTMRQLQAQLLWQLTALRFIDQRFRPGILVTDEDIQAYFEQHRQELQKVSGGANTLQALEPKIREIIIGERVNQSFEEWLEQVRRRTRVDYRERAFVDTRQGAAR